MTKINFKDLKDIMAEIVSGNYTELITGKDVKKRESKTFDETVVKTTVFSNGEAVDRMEEIVSSKKRS